MKAWLDVRRLLGWTPNTFSLVVGEEYPSVADV